MAQLKRRDLVELAVAVIVMLAYFGLWASGEIPEDTPMLVHLMVGGSVFAILGDNVSKYLEAVPAVDPGGDGGDG